MLDVYEHFSKIASEYDELRTTDKEPILFIKQKLGGLTRIMAADVGCGTGRYDLELFYHLGERLSLTCIDDNEAMLRSLSNLLTQHDIHNFRTVRSPAKNLPLPDSSLDCLFAFNSIHHFEITKFFGEVSRVLKPDGLLFVYTRLRSQNKNHIWGRYFPGFYEREKLLYELNEIRQIIEDFPALEVESVQYFKYKRKSSLEQLLNQARGHHYSTFSLYYNPQEFSKALKGFKQNILDNFDNTDEIVWDNDMTMLVIRKSRQ